MVQINYDGEGLYTIDRFTKEREPIPADSLPEEFNPGEIVFFDHNNKLTFHKSVTRKQFVSECQRAYKIFVDYTKKTNYFLRNIYL